VTDSEKWHRLEKRSLAGNDLASAVLELRATVEALEGKYETMRLATLEWGEDVDKVKRWSDQHLRRIMALEAAVGIRSGPESSLVELVADAIAAQATCAGIINDRPARAAIRVVATWLREHGTPAQGCAMLLEQEANPTNQED
jgi:hypothetical protein